MKRLWNIIAGATLLGVILAGIVTAQEGNITLVKNGDTVTISGSTNLAVGDRLLVNVVSAAFTPMEKGGGGGFSGAAGTVVVQQGSPLNSFSFDMNVSAFPPGEYLVTVESVETGLTESSQFVLPWTPVPTATIPKPTTIPATITTPPASTPVPSPSATAKPIPLSGILPIGAFVIAVSVLALRR